MSQQDKLQNERNYAGMMVKVYNWLREYQKRTNGNWLVFSVGSSDGHLKCYLFGGHGGQAKIGNPNTKFSVDVMMSGYYRGLWITFEVDKKYSNFGKMTFSIGWGMPGQNGRSKPDDAIIELGEKFEINGKKFDFSKKICQDSKPIKEFDGSQEDVKKVLYDFLDENAESFKAIPDEFKLNASETNNAIEQRIAALKQLGLVAADPKGDLFVPDSADYLVMLKADMADGGEGVAEQTDKSIGDARGRNVIILRWNPYEKEEDGRAKWKDYERALKSIKTGRPWKEDWSCHTTDVRKGDTIYIYKADGKKYGKKNEEAGIVARGRVVSDRRVENGEGRVDIEIDSMVDYTREEYITCSTIKTLTKDGSEAKEFSSYGREYQRTGFPLPDVFDEKKMSDAWNSLLSEALKKMIVGKSLNCIRFGAPGTGKSFEINKRYENVGWASKERVTFHPDYSYANFVGAYKPYMNGEKEISYAFVPGPFTRVLANALRDPNGKHLLVIEEINRANTAAVFGDVFQLLDRGENGESEYAISPSQDLAKFLRMALEKMKPSEVSSGDGDNEDDWWWLTTEKPAMDQKKIRALIRNLKIPSNMYLWATMNSADQGVFPMDTAFKRRWSFEYVGINDGESELKKSGKLAELWNELRKLINQKLCDLKVNEDKCMGPFFLTEGDLNDVETFDKVFKSKVLMYLFEDAARQKRTQVFADGCDTLSKISDAVNDKEKCVFKDGKEGDLNKTLERILALKNGDRDKSTTDGQAQAEEVASTQQKSQEST